ncbi:MAG: hypothetical protein ACOY0T_20820 [Myxococcota bacterium]
MKRLRLMNFACWLVAGLVPVLVSGHARAQSVVVSITFDDAIDDTVTDDGPATQLDNVYPLASNILSDGDLIPNEATCPNVGGLGTVPQLAESSDCDVPATFYVNWPRLDESKFFSTQAVQELDAMGHEIGGHSAHHLELPKLESANGDSLDLNEQRLQVCWDRMRLSLVPKLDGSGTLDVVSFAYPFGEHQWLGAVDLVSRFGAPGPTLLGNETRNIVGAVYPGECSYRNGRTTLGAANSPECTDRDPATPCVWAESTQPPNPFALRVPSSVQHLTPIDYPLVPPNDDGNGIYDRPEEFEARANSIKGWVENAIAHPPASGKNWVVLTFHTVCFAYRCNQYGIEYHEFKNLVTWLRQKRSAGEIQLASVREVLKQTKELKVNVPALPAPIVSVQNGDLSRDINRDYLPDCFDSAGTGLFSGGLALLNPVYADADADGNGLADDGFGADRFYGWLLMAGGTTRGRFFTRMDLGHCAPYVMAGNAYQLRFRYRAPNANAPRHCGFHDAPDQPPCPINLTDQAPTGLLPNYYLIYAFRRPVGMAGDRLDDGAWGGFVRVPLARPVGTWSDAVATVTAPSGTDAVTFGIEIEHDDADGRVDLDVDDFSYCRLSNDEFDLVPACSL